MALFRCGGGSTVSPSTIHHKAGNTTSTVFVSYTFTEDYDAVLVDYYAYRDGGLAARTITATLASGTSTEVLSEGMTGDAGNTAKWGYKTLLLKNVKSGDTISNTDGGTTAVFENAVFVTSI